MLQLRKSLTIRVKSCGGLREVRLKLLKQKLWCGGISKKCGGNKKSVVEITIPFFIKINSWINYYLNLFFWT